MKIEVKDKKGKLLEEHFFDLEQVLLSAQGQSGLDPVKTAADALCGSLEEKGIFLQDEEKLHLQKQMDDGALHGDDTGILKVIGERSAKSNGKNHPRMSGSMNQSELFERILIYPADGYKEQYDSLVGLDSVKERLVKEAILITLPSALEKWSKDKHKGKSIAALKALRQRSPFLIFAGDVGTGKTALAESFGNAIAESVRKDVKLFRLSIMTRGGGIVGEMTKLITAAFKAAEYEANSSQVPTILLLDEADALAQSREAVQMHHEDKAGVNALIQGLDRIRLHTKTMLVIFCTNRLSAIDPAIRRRAADIFEFERPNDRQREKILKMYCGDIGFSDDQVQDLVKLTGPNGSRAYGFSYSDLVNRVIPSAVFSSYPDSPLTFKTLKETIERVSPTAPFNER